MNKVILTGLEGIKRKEIEAAWIDDVTDISNVLKKGRFMNEIKELKLAILHCQCVQSERRVNKKCRADHKKLEQWLRELLEIKISQKG